MQYVPLIAEILFGSNIFLLFVPVRLLLASVFSSKRASIIFRVNGPGSLEVDFTLRRIFLESLTPFSGDPMFTSVKKRLIFFKCTVVATKVRRCRPIPPPPPPLWETYICTGIAVITPVNLRTT